MALFGKRQAPTQPPRPSTRTVPTLDPEYFARIESQLLANGGAVTATEIAYGVGNALFNTGVDYLQRCGAHKELRDFEALYEYRSPDDVSAADRMIDFLVGFDPSMQSGDTAWLTTLLRRLDEVLSRPA